MPDLAQDLVERLGDRENSLGEGVTKFDGRHKESLCFRGEIIHQQAGVAARLASLIRISLSLRMI